MVASQGAQAVDSTHNLFKQVLQLLIQNNVSQAQQLIAGFKAGPDYKVVQNFPVVQGFTLSAALLNITNLLNAYKLNEAENFIMSILGGQEKDASADARHALSEALYAVQGGEFTKAEHLLDSIDLSKWEGLRVHIPNSGEMTLAQAIRNCKIAVHLVLRSKEAQNAMAWIAHVSELV